MNTAIDFTRNETLAYLKQNFIDKVCFDFGAEGPKQYVADDYNTVLNYILLLTPSTSDTEHCSAQEDLLNQYEFCHNQSKADCFYLSDDELRTLQIELYSTYKKLHPSFCNFPHVFNQKYKNEIRRLEMYLEEPWLVFYATKFCTQATDTEAAELRSQNNDVVFSAFQSLSCSQTLANALFSARKPMARFITLLTVDRHLGSYLTNNKYKKHKHIKQVISFVPYKVYPAEEFFKRH